MHSRCVARRVSWLAMLLVVAAGRAALGQSALDRCEAALAAYRDGRYGEAVAAAAARTQRDLEAVRAHWFDRTGDSAPPTDDTGSPRLRLAAAPPRGGMLQPPATAVGHDWPLA